MRYGEKALYIFKKDFDSNINSQIILQKVFLTSGQNDPAREICFISENYWKKSGKKLLKCILSI